MTEKEIFAEVADTIGGKQNVTQRKSIFKRKLTLALEELDPLVQWRCAIIDFSTLVRVNKNRVSVSNVNLFKPIICKYVDDDSVEFPLTYREMTNFQIQDAKYGTGTNDFPTIYSLGGGYIYVGPGIMGTAASIQGMVQRRLTHNDVEQLPGPMIVDGIIARMAKDVDIRTNARINWFTNKKAIVTAAHKKTAEERDVQDIDPVILRNQRYMAENT